MPGEEMEVGFVGGMSGPGKADGVAWPLPAFLVTGPWILLMCKWANGYIESNRETPTGLPSRMPIMAQAGAEAARGPGA